MPPKKKKQPKNAFYFFMMDWKAEKEEQGQRFSGLKEVAELCDEDWKHLPKFNVDHYKEMEKEAKQKDKTDLSNKFNAQGVPFQQLEMEKKEREDAASRMHSDIDSTMTTISANLESLKSHYFYLVHTNVYCYWGKNQVYIPCEVAISKFNLRDGLVDSYHVFPCPFTKDCKIPLGYKSAVNENTRLVHEIPDPSEFDRVEYDWNKIRADIHEFLKPNGGSDIPPLYTMQADDTNVNCHMTAVKNFFDFLAGDSNDDYRIYSITLLFFKLYLACQQVAVNMFGDNERAFPVEGVAHQQLNKDVYNFSPGIACSFHETTEHFHNCSLSFVKRWVFLICEFCCKALRIDIIPGHHCLTTARIVLSKQEELPRPQSQSTTRSQMMPSSPSPYSSSARSGAATAAGGNADDDSENDEDWRTIPKVHHRMKNLSLEGNRVDSPQTGAWGMDSRSRGQQIAGAWGSGSRGQGSKSAQTEEILVIDHSKTLDLNHAKVLRTGQSPNVVSEIMPSNAEPIVRRPTTHGRGELMARALQHSSPGAALSSEDFPAIGASRPGRLAKPLTAGWGRGFLKQ